MSPNGVTAYRGQTAFEGRRAPLLGEPSTRGMKVRARTRREDALQPRGSKSSSNRPVLCEGVPPTDDEIREMAKARVGFRANLIAYVLINPLLVLIWWINSGFAAPSFADDDASYFWPIWPIVGWGIGLAFHAWGAYGGGKDAVSREEQKLRSKYGMK